jgi:hypothetical protein
MPACGETVNCAKAGKRFVARGYVSGREEESGDGKYLKSSFL